MVDYPTTNRTNPIALGTEETIRNDLNDKNTALEGDNEEYKEFEYEALAAYLISEFEKNKWAREDSGLEEDIQDSLRAVNGEYSNEDKGRISRTGGSSIFMNLTATKARAARSWIADILFPPKGKSWSIEPTPIEDLPEEMKKLLETRLEEEFNKRAQPAQQGVGQPPIQPQQAMGPGAPPPIQPPTAEEAQTTIREENQKKRDIYDAVREEITNEAKFQLRKMEQKIDDQLIEGNWSKALSDFLDDFVTYPTAFMKGPVISRKKCLVWKDGEATEAHKYIYMNERVDPLDIYPSPSGVEVEDGNFVEHMRLTKATLAAFKGVKNFKNKAIDRALEDYENGGIPGWIDDDIEDEKADQEKRGNYLEAQEGIIHALHFWGVVPKKKFEEWDLYEKVEDLEDLEDNDPVDVEAIIVGNHVIKCIVNDDPLKRRPYYKASFVNIPGSFWGRSLANLMSSVQRMCNAAARALSNNLGVASGPQIELYVDRLADDGDIDSIEPFKIWQLKSDPTGAGGRAMNFFQPSSNAQELLAVYNNFEEKADDVTGIPRYAYGNEKTAGAAQTAQGLAMLLESTSKIIKDCIRNIDEGLIKPRIKYQFYHNMVNLDDFNYTGDINIETIGSHTLSVRGAEAARRNEFLQATANPTDLQVLGYEGRLAILRTMAEDLNLDTSIMPTTFEYKQKLKETEARAEQQAQAMAQAEQAKAQAGIQATQIQIEGQKEMHQTTMQKEMAKLQLEMQKFNQEMQVKIADIQRKAKADQNKADSDMFQEQGKKERQTQEVALAMNKGEGI
jgi:hypothetical protein